MEIRKVHCLFEQSGTFKNAFKNLGIDAEDYDILNTYSQTDHQIDLFAEIENAYNEKASIFDNVGSEDLVVIKNRNKEGDYFKKPTQFFFINCEPEQNVVFEPIEMVEVTRVDDAQMIEQDGTRQEKRSLLHPQFVDRFIKTYVVTKEDKVWM